MPVNNVFADMGFSTIALPSTNVEPLQLLMKKKGALTRLPDKIDMLLESPPDFQFSPLSKDNPVPELAGGSSLLVDSTAKVGILSSLKAKIGIGADANLTVNKDESVVFAYDNPTKDELGSILELTKLLNSSRISPFGARRDIKLGRYYVITAVLKSNKFAVGVVDNNKISGGTNINFKELVESDITFSRSLDKNRVLIYDNPEPLVFGFQAWQLDYKNPLFGKPYFRLKATSNKTTMRGGGLDKDADLLVVDASELVFED